jgi:predicted transposase/invertase (TIGR01784 family)
MKFIKDPTSIQEEFLKIPEDKEAMDELTYMSADPETRAVYDARVKELNDIYSGMTTKYKEGLEAGRTEGEKIGIEKGEKIGIEKGKAEGEKKAKIETAKNLIKIGLSVEQISLATGLSIEEIEALKL